MPSLCDKLGRKRMYGLELIIILLGTFGQSISGACPGLAVVGPLIFWRVIMGVGIGGGCPLSSVISSKFSTIKWRGALMNSVFAMLARPLHYTQFPLTSRRRQGFGNFAAALVSFVCVISFKDSLIGIANPSLCDTNCQMAADKMWRTIVAFGALAAILAL